MEYPEIVALCQRAEATQWDIGDAIVKRLGPTGNNEARDGSRAELEKISKEIAAVGIERTAETLRVLRRISTIFPQGFRNPCSWSVHAIAGTPEMLAKILAVDSNPTRDKAREIKARLQGKEKKKPEPKTKEKTDRQKQREYRNDEIIAMSDAGKSVKEIAEITGLDDSTIYDVINKEKIRRAARAEAEAEAKAKEDDPLNRFSDEFWTSPEARNLLTKKNQKVLDRTIRAYAKKLADEFEGKVRERIKYWYEKLMTGDIKERLRQAEQTVDSRKGIMTRQEFNSLLYCLHPDTGDKVSVEKRTEAFRLLDGLKFKLLSAKDDPQKPVTPPPATWAEFKAKFGRK